MSNLPPPQALLTAIVLESERSPLCALHRVPLDDRGPSAFAAAALLGFSKNEARGIMDGWDSSNGRARIVFQDYAPYPGYAEGYALGARLHALASEAGLVDAPTYDEAF